jgi:N-acetylmuramoyl-L-alanine amidase
MLLVACLPWLGCDERPWVSGKADPKEETNYRQAEAYQRMNQFPKAVEYYQRALDVNPRNADAHLGLGIIHSDSAKLPEYGFAYYHLRRYLSLSGRTNDLIVNQLVRATGLRLAELHADAIGKIQTQGQLEQMRRENDELRKAVHSLSNQLQNASPRSSATGPTAAAAPPGPAITSTRMPASKVQTPSPTRAVPASPNPPRAEAKAVEPKSRPAARPPTPEPRRSSTPKTYRMKPGDTLAAIAAAQGITLQQLQAANPGVDTRRLKPGSEIRVP